MLHPLPILFLFAAVVLTAGCQLNPSPQSPKMNQPTVAAEETPDPFLDQFARTYRFRLGKPGSFKLTPNGDAVLFLRSPNRSFVQDLYSFDVATGQERVLLTAKEILGAGDEQLSAEEKARRERMRLAAKGIAGSRVDTRAAGGQKGAGKQNRRIDVVWLPEGATY